MFKRNSSRTVYDQMDELNRSTNSLHVWTAKKLLHESQAQSGINGDIEKAASAIFIYSFWNPVSKKPIESVEMSFIVEQFERIAKHPQVVPLVAKMAASLWSIEKHVEQTLDASYYPVRLRLTQQGKDYLVRKLDSLPPAYVAVRDALSSPLAKLGWIVGVISSLIAIYQVFRPPFQ